MKGVHVFALVTAVATLGFMLELLRRRQLREKYAAVWLPVGLAVAVLAVFPRLLDRAADVLGVADPPNLLLFLAALMLLLSDLHLSWEVSRLESETRTLAEEVALLRMRLDALDDSVRP